MALPAEFQLIAKHFKPLADVPGALGLADDAALLTPPAGRELVIAADAMVAGVHFLEDDPADTIGRKLLRVNLSDLAAMGAVPLGFVMTLALPKTSNGVWLRGFAAGLMEDRRRFEVPLLGGDTVSTPGPISLSLTILGHIEPGKCLRRQGALAGDSIWVSGTLGDGALGLCALDGRLRKLPGKHMAYLSDRYRLPEPRLALGQRLVGVASAGLDVSDGLLQDVGHLARAAGCAASVDAAALPKSEAAAAALAADPALISAIAAGGDDYELAFTAPAGSEEAIRAAGREAGVRVTRIGQLRAGEPGDVALLDESGKPMKLATQGWSHF